MNRRIIVRGLAVLVSIFGTSLLVSYWVAAASNCPVPSGSHATIQSAVDDSGCAKSELALRWMPEHRPYATGQKLPRSTSAATAAIRSMATQIRTTEITVTSAPKNALGRHRHLPPPRWPRRPQRPFQQTPPHLPALPSPLQPRRRE